LGAASPTCAQRCHDERQPRFATLPSHQATAQAQSCECRSSGCRGGGCSLMNRCNEDDCWGSFTALLIQNAKERRLVLLKVLIGQCTILSIREEYKIEGAIACRW